MGTHRIKRQFVEVMTDYSPDAFRFKELLGEMCKQKLLPALEKLFDAKAPDHKIIHTGKLVIDVGELPVGNWETLFVDRVIDEMTKRISAAVPLSSAKNEYDDEVFQEIDEETNAMRSILHFLERGVLPWFTVIRSKGELQQWMIKLLSNENLLQSIINIIRMNSNVVDRLVYQFDEGVIDSIVTKAGIERKFIDELWCLWEPVFDQMKWDKTRQKKAFHKALLEGIVAKGQGFEMQRLQDQLLTADLFELVKNGKVKEQRGTQKTEPVNDALYINNAGLVIIHPFLPALFSNLGYTEKDEWISEDVQHRAITLMQYLVSGKEEYPEFDLMLNKILLGFPVDKTLPADIIISDFEKSEAMDLLNSIIKHWTALKNTSVEGLQSTFLMREGKLSMGETGWLLQVEQKTVDILMGKLPWGISVVKTPWMEKMMHVEWA